MHTKNIDDIAAKGLQKPEHDFKAVLDSLKLPVAFAEQEAAAEQLTKMADFNSTHELHAGWGGCEGCGLLGGSCGGAVFTM